MADKKKEAPKKKTTTKAKKLTKQELMAKRGIQLDAQFKVILDEDEK